MFFGYPCFLLEMLLLSVFRARVLCSRLRVRGAGNNEEIFYFIPFRSYLVVPHDPSPIDCATPPGFVMLSCPVCTSSCRWGFDATSSPNLCCFFYILYW